MKNHANTEQPIALPKEVLVKAQERAGALGLTLAEYVQSLVDQDVATSQHDPWRDPVPPAVAERWSRELAEFEAEDKTNPRPRAKTVGEFRKQLEAEVAQLSDDDDEGN